MTDEKKPIIHQDPENPISVAHHVDEDGRFSFAVTCGGQMLVGGFNARFTGGAGPADNLGLQQQPPQDQEPDHE